MKNFFFILIFLSPFIVQSQDRGTFIDSRDGKKYPWLRIGSQVWMVKNLAYKPSSGNYWALDNNSSNVIKYGYLYDWHTAKNVCPSGWRLPSKSDFEYLLGNYGGPGINAYNALSEGGSSGFSIQLNLGCWSASSLDTDKPYFLVFFDYDKEADISWMSYNKEDGLWVRCIRE